MTPTRRPSETVDPRRRRRGQARGLLTRLPVIGRWSVLGDEERLSPEEREEARAQLLLARYGIVARELARGDWATLRHTLLRMEYGGEVVRGYFVHGLSGEQYALADALADLDTPARRAGPNVLVTTIDPANLWGRIFALSRRDGSRVSAARLPQNWLVFRQGRPRLLVEGSGRDLTPLAGWEDVDLPGVIAAFQSMMERPLTLRPVRRLEIMTWDGHPVRGSAVVEPLVAAGFTADGGRLPWDGYPGPRSVRRSRGEQSTRRQDRDPGRRGVARAGPRKREGGGDPFRTRGRSRPLRRPGEGPRRADRRAHPCRGWRGGSSRGRRHAGRRVPGHGQGGGRPMGWTRHPAQQRRDRVAQGPARDHRGRLGSRHQRRPQVDVPRHAGRGARHGAPRRRRRRVCLVDRGNARLWAYRVRDRQGRRDRLRPLGGRSVWAQGHPRQRHRTGPGVDADGRGSRSQGPRTPAAREPARHRGYRLGRGLGRRLPRQRRGALGDRAHAHHRRGPDDHHAGGLTRRARSLAPAESARRRPWPLWPWPPGARVADCDSAQRPSRRRTPGQTRARSESEAMPPPPPRSRPSARPRLAIRA